MWLRAPLLGVVLCPLLLFAQTSDVELGRAMYRSNCAFCHGLTGLGGRGPDLVGAQQKDDAEMKRIIRSGVPGTTMPAFASFEPAEIEDVIAFIKRLRGAGTEQHKASGDPANGRRMYARHNCSGCHQIGSEGSVYGPDLTRIGGSRSLKYLEQSILDPSDDVPEGFQGVKVITPAGREFTGIRINEDTFTVQMRLPSQEFKSFLKETGTKQVVPLKESLMPSYKGMPKQVLDDLVAYLTTLRGQAEAGAAVKKVEGIR